MRPIDIARRLLVALLPHGERDEVADDLAAEYGRRRRGSRLAAWVWLWRQVLGSVPHLLGRTGWRGRTGFEPEANRMRAGGPMIETWIMDGRYAVRRLLKRPQYALLATLTLALGVGGTAAIWGIARTLLLSPLPIAAEEDVAVWWMARNWRESELLHLRAAGTPGFDAVAAYGLEDVRLTGGGATQVMAAVRTSADLFDVLGVAPALGAGFQPGDDALGAEPKVMLSHGMWRDLGSDPSIVGARIELNGVPRTVAGVMPAGFWFPDPSVRVWVARQFNPENHAGWYTIIGRLRGGQTPGEIEGALGAITASLGEQFEYSPAWDNTADPVLTPVREHILGSARPTLVATLAAMAVILLMACANVAALMLGQTEGRGTELSVRSALGAGRLRLTQQLLAEAAALGVAAGIAGAAVAVMSFRVLRAALPLGALAERATMDWTLFFSALGLALAAALVIALIPVAAMLRSELRGALSTSRTGGITGRGGRVESGLVVAEVALAVMVAAAGGLLMRSVGNLRAIETGLDASSVAVIDVVAPAEATHEERSRMMRELVDELRSIPGVTGAAAAATLPLRGGGNNWGLTIEGRPDVTGVTTSFRAVSRDYFDVMGIRLRSGRLFEAGDRADTERTVIINETLAREFFPDEDPIGRRIGDFGDFSRIIGVVADVKEGGLTDDPAPARYLLYDQIPYAQASHSLVLRVRDGLQPLSVIDAARAVIARSAPRVGIQETTSMERLLDRALGPARQLMTLLSLLAALAVALGGVGVYGVVSHFVNRRRRDWGVRLALGYRPAQIVGHVLRRGTLLVSAGAVLGIGGAILLTRVLSAFVYGVGTTDPGTLAGAALVLFAIGALGALIPATRASRVDPARVLREQ
jgi:putative ABC transport system permease protein